MSTVPRVRRAVPGADAVEREHEVIVAFRKATSRKDALGPRPPMPSDKNCLDGYRMGGLLRVSTPEQVDNYSARNMDDSLTRAVEARGATLDLRDEQGVSGRRLHKRDVTLRLLDDIHAGELQGLAVPDIKRLTRDEFGVDAATIAMRLAEARAPLLAGDRVYYLWDVRDRFQYGIEVQLAGHDLIGVRDTLWRGIFGRAEEGVYFHGTTSFGYVTDVVEMTNARGHVKVKRVPKKDPAAAEAMAYLIRCLDACPSLGLVTRRMNDAGYLPFVRRGAYKGTRRMWSTGRLRLLLETPIYQGVFDFGHCVDRSNIVWDADTRRERLAPISVPHLAYWTPAQVKAWGEKFSPGPTGRARTRAGTYDRPLVGVLACGACGRPMISAGATGYQCPTRSMGPRITGATQKEPGAQANTALCPTAQTVSHKLALRALRTVILDAVREAHRAEAYLRGERAGRSELDKLRARVWALEDGSEVTAEEWYGRRMPDAFRARMEHDQLTLDREREEARAPVGAEAEIAIQRVMDEPAAVGDMDDDDLCRLIRQVLVAARVAGQGRGAGRRVWIAGYTNRITGASVTPEVLRVVKADDIQSRLFGDKRYARPKCPLDPPTVARAAAVRAANAAARRTMGSGASGGGAARRRPGASGADLGQGRTCHTGGCRR